MSGGVDMRSPLANVREDLGKKATAHRVRALIIPVNRLPPFAGKTGPVRDSGLKFMSKIDIGFRSKSFLNFPERSFLSGVRDRKQGCENQSSCRRDAAISKRHFPFVK